MNKKKKQYYLMDVRAWIAYENNKSILDSAASVYCVEHGLKNAERELLNSFNDAMIVDKDFKYVHSDHYKQFEKFRYDIRRSHFIGRDPILDKKENTEIEVLTSEDIFTESELDAIEKEAMAEVKSNE